MKFLYLLGSRLSLYFKKNKLLFLLFFFCGVASSISFLFFYGQLPSVQNRNSTSFVYRKYTVTDILSGISADTLKELHADPMVENVTLIHMGVEGASKRLAASLGEDPGRVRVRGANSFEGADPYSMIVPSAVGKAGAKKVDDKVTVEGVEFTVIGVYSSGALSFSYIPLETYMEMGLSTESATVYAADKADADSGAMVAKLKETLGSDITIGEPERVNEMDEAFSRDRLKSLSITYGVVILVFLFLFLQMVAETGRETAICRTFGATGARIALMHFCEVLLLTGASALAGILLHSALYKPVFSKLNAAEGVPYFPGDYLFVFGVIIGVTVVISVPYVIRCLFLSPKEATLTAAK